MSSFNTFLHYAGATFPRWAGWVVGAFATTTIFIATAVFAPHYPTVLYFAVGSFVGGVVLSCLLLVRDASRETTDQDAFQEVMAREATVFLRRVNWLALASASFYLGAVPLIGFVRSSPVMASLLGLAITVVGLSVYLGSRARRDNKVSVVMAVGERLAEPENLFHVRVSETDLQRVALTQAARLMVGKPFVNRGLYRIRQAGQDGGVTFLLPNSIDSLPMVEWKVWSLYAGLVAERLVLGDASILQGPEVRGADGLVLQAMALRGDDPAMLSPRNERERLFLAARIKAERRRYTDELEAFFRAGRNLDVLKAIQKRLLAPGIPPPQSVKSWMEHVSLTTNYPLATKQPKPAATVEKLTPAGQGSEGVRKLA